MTEKNGALNASQEELHVLARGSTKAAKPVSPRLLVDSGTHATAFTNPDGSLPAWLPLVINPVADSARCPPDYFGV